jgi:Tfp pilus assembly protein PilO
MKLDLKSTGGMILGMVLVVVAGIAFWMLAVSPKRDEAAKLDKEASKLEASLALHRSEISEGEEARKQFPVDYQKLVVLGKAVPGDDDTASLLVQINHIAEKTGLHFHEIKLNTTEGGESEETAAAPVGASPTEAAASLLPLGATIGSAGLAVMPYTLTFEGDFFKIADFVERVDSLVRTRNQGVLVDGRLITVDAFSLAPDPNKEFPALQVSFSITTYLTPPGESVTAGASPTSPTAEGTPASATIGETP